MSDTTKKQITIGFNVLMFIYLCFGLLAEYLSEPENPAKAPLDILLDNSPVASIVLIIVFVFLLIVTGAFLLKLFWNRFISDIFKVRDITYQEAVAILFIATVVFR